MQENQIIQSSVLYRGKCVFDRFSRTSDSIICALYLNLTPTINQFWSTDGNVCILRTNNGIQVSMCGVAYNINIDESVAIIINEHNYKSLIRAIKEYNNSRTAVFYYTGGSHIGYRQIIVAEETKTHIKGFDVDDQDKKFKNYLKSKIRGRIHYST